LDHLCSLSDRLYLETPNSSSVYRILRPPQAFRELLPERPDQTELITDWNEVLWTMDGMRVTPEMADQLSGAIYMHALMQEDVTCKCIRSTDYINQLSINQLQTIVDNISFWSRMELHDIHASDMLQLILTALDRRCCTLPDLTSDKSKGLAVGFTRLVKFFHKSSTCKFLDTAFNSLDSVDSKEDIVIMMLVASVCHNAPAVKLTANQDLMRLLAAQIDINFNNLTHTELAVCLTGLQAGGKAASKELSQLGRRAAMRYGFRI